jgi:pimeloyl-ACP methyl ester carboxylesterase
MKVIWRAMVALLLACSAAHGQETLVGSWQGSILIGNARLGIALRCAARGDSLVAVMDIPQQGASGLRLSNVRAPIPAVHFELQAGPGLAVFDGVLRSDTVAGEFRQAAFTGTFTLTRMPPETVPYRVEEVSFLSDAIALQGTLTLPEGPGPFPAAVLIAGSGGVDRDEVVFGFPVLRTLADSLTRQGLAVLRYDKRGVGQSSGTLSAATTEDLAQDARAALRYLLERKEIDRQRAGLIGHSEGSAVAMTLAASDTAVAFVVALAGAAVDGERLVLDQVERIERLKGTSQQEIERLLALQREVLASSKSGSIGAPLRAKLREEYRREFERQLAAMPPDQRAQLPGIDSLAGVRVEAEITTLTSRGYRSFLSYDPSEAVRRVRVPVLALFGEKDSQVAPALNRPPMERALGIPGTTLHKTHVIPGVNHLFQEAQTGAPWEYGRLRKEFHPALLNEILRWVHRPGGE